MKNVPTFPIFSKIKLTHKEDIELFAKKYPYSTFNFANLWAWNIRKNRKISQLNGNLILQLADYETNEYFLTFAGSSLPARTIETLIDFARENKMSTKLRYVPKETVAKTKSKKIQIQKDTKNAEYVYAVEKIAQPKGKKLKSKRLASKNFQKQYPSAVFTIERLNLKNINEVERLFELWESQTSQKDKEVNAIREHTAIQRLMQLSKKCDFLFSSVHDEGRLVAFSIDEIVTPQLAIGHFVKADRTYRGIYEYINEKTASFFLTLGVRYWNWQQDLGIEGLKKVKLSYNPDHFKEKFTVSLGQTTKR